MEGWFVLGAHHDAPEKLSSHAPFSTRSPQIEHSVLGGLPTTISPTTTCVHAVDMRRPKEAQYRNDSAEIQPVTCKTFLSYTRMDERFAATAAVPSYRR